MNLAELLHLCSASGRSGTIRFSFNNQSGEIHLNDGNVTFANFDSETGDKALLQMLIIRGGSSQFTPGSTTKKKNVTIKCEQALLEAARISDEAVVSKTLSLKSDTNESETIEKPLARLRLLPETTGWNYPIPNGKEVTIGRTPDNAICIEHETISSHHCRLQIELTGIILSDLNSLNGTFVNGKRVKMVVLSDQDLVQMGDATFRLELTA